MIQKRSWHCFSFLQQFNSAGNLESLALLAQSSSMSLASIVELVDSVFICMPTSFSNKWFAVEKGILHRIKLQMKLLPQNPPPYKLIFYLCARQLKETSVGLKSYG